MYLPIIITACILCGIVAIVSFVLFVKYRMSYREAEEERYKQIHFISLTLFALFGVLILIELSHRYNQPRIYY